MGLVGDDLIETWLRGLVGGVLNLLVGAGIHAAEHGDVHGLSAAGQHLVQERPHQDLMPQDGVLLGVEQ